MDQSEEGQCGVCVWGLQHHAGGLALEVRSWYGMQAVQQHSVCWACRALASPSSPPHMHPLVLQRAVVASVCAGVLGWAGLIQLVSILQAAAGTVDII